MHVCPNVCLFLTNLHLSHSCCIFTICNMCCLTDLCLTGVVSGEMFRNMQNSEIIRRMTEEFDEVCFSRWHNYNL